MLGLDHARVSLFWNSVHRTSSLHMLALIRDVPRHATEELPSPFARLKLPAVADAWHAVAVLTSNIKNHNRPVLYHVGGCGSVPRPAKAI